MRLSHFLFVLTCLLFVECTNDRNRETRSQSTVDHQDSIEISPSTEAVPDEDDFIIDFGDVTLYIDSFEVWDQGFKLTKDTAIIYLELGQDIEGKTIGISNSLFKDVKLYQSHENSISISGEGPHCDLVDWKHFNSNWESISIKNNMATVYSYSGQERSAFVDVSMDEVRDAVREQCSDGWASLLDSTTSINEYPCNVLTNRIYIRVVLTNPENDLNREKLVIFEVPMGC
ncbi:MAG: hypothetical protein JJ975_08605 [Bacteroidia bacterium]|nr:hypothetical protein [Bacteroidia bacterium]